MQKLSDTLDSSTKKKLNVLDDNETRRERIWKECVTEGKILLTTSAEIRMKIVLLAEKCCTIHHGGRSFETRFTVHRFAEEIGMNGNTLHEWIRLKRNVLDNLDQKEKDVVKTTDLWMIDRQLKGVRRNTPEYKAEVKKVAKSILSRNKTTVKMMKYQKHLNTILFNVKNPAMVKDCDRGVLAELLYTTRQISKHLNWVDLEVKTKKK